MKSTREKWRGRTYDFYLIRHEHLYVFRKAAEGENLRTTATAGSGGDA